MAVFTVMIDDNCQISSNFNEIFVSLISDEL